MLRAVVFLCAVVTIAAVQTTAVSKCTRYPGDLPLNTYVEGCVETPCQLPQLQDAVIHVVFKSSRVMHSMTTMANAFLSLGSINTDIPYNLGANAVTCNFLTNTYCPVVKDEIVTYTLRMYIEPFFPVGTTVTIEFRVLDQDRQPALCIRMPVTIVRPVVSPNRHLRNNSTDFIGH